LSTLNPLFLDSTKPVGDKVVTNVELFSILLHDGDSLYFEVTDQFGFMQRFAMKAVETKKSVKYTAEVWLKYQHQIQYRFLIVTGGEDAFASAAREAHAGHIISEKWSPCLEQKVTEVKKVKSGNNRTGVVKESRLKSGIKTGVTKPLRNPPLFEQIKSLIEDLM